MHTRLIELGPPGTGKTHSLIQHIESRDGTALICSLTRAAAREIADRAKRSPDQMTGTLHSICYQALGRPGMPDIEEFNERYGYSIKTRREMDIEFDKDDILQRYYITRSLNRNQSTWPDDLQDFSNKWEAFKAVTRSVDFIDMIENAPQKPPGDPSLIIFDEAQDASRAEIEVIKRWSQYADTVIAGDDDQALYTWRGADPEAFLGFTDNYRVLDQSYRVPRSVLEYSQRWISQISSRVPKEYKPRNASGSVQYISSKLQYLEDMIDVLKSLNGTTMILTTCNYMLPPVIKELKKNLIPFHNPWKIKNKAWNPISKSTQSIVNTWMMLNTIGTAPTWKNMYKLSKCMKRGSAFNIRSETLLRSRNKNTSSMTYEDISKVMTDDGKLMFTSGDVGYFRDNLTSSGYGMQFQLNLIEKYGASIFQKDPDVIIGTINSVKGGEADNVILFPSLSSAGMDQYYEDPDSIIRLFYVGMTRARENLILCEGRGVEWI